MKYNLFEAIIKVCNSHNINATLKFIGDVNEKINKLIERGISENCIVYNMEVLVLELKQIN